MRLGVPSHVELIADEFGVGQVFDAGGVEEDGEVGVLLVGVVAVGVVGLVDQFDFLDEFLFLLIEVGVGGVDDQAKAAGFGDRLGAGVEFLDSLELIFFTCRHKQI